jgi:hypothetical protein
MSRGARAVRAQWALVVLIGICVGTWSENGKSGAGQLYRQDETGRVSVTNISR